MLNIEEIEARLAVEKEPREKFKLLILLRPQVDLDRAGAIAQEAYDLAVQIGDRGLMGRGMIAIADAAMDKGDFVGSYPYWVKARELVEKNTSAESKVLTEIAAVYMEMNRPDEASKYNLEALAVAQAAGDRLREAIVRANLAILYHKLDYGDLALQYATESLEVSRQIDDIYGCAHALNLLGTIWGGLCNDHEKAIECFQQGVAIAEEHKLMPIGALLFVNMAEAHLRLGNTEMGATCLTEAGERFQLHSGRFLGAFLHYLGVCGNCELLQGNTDQALYYGGEVLNGATAIRRNEQIFQAHDLLAQTYARRGDFEKALEHFRQFHTVKQKVFNEEAQRKMQLLTVEYDVERTKAAQALAEKEGEIVRLKNEELSIALQDVRALNEKLVELNNEKNEMLEIVAHDLKSPLAGIRMVSALLKEHHNKMPEEELVQQLEGIEQTSERILRIAANWLDVHAIESHTIYTSDEEIDVSAIVRRVADSYTAEAARKQIALRVECANQFITRGNVEALQQVVDNLISNALKFTPVGKNVWVRTALNGNTIAIEIEDEGPGIAEADRKKMFGKYGRLSAQPTGGESSTGLGLWIVHKIVESLSGTISCRSEVGMGATFVVELPAATPA